MWAQRKNWQTSCCIANLKHQTDPGGKTRYIVWSLITSFPGTAASFMIWADFLVIRQANSTEPALYHTSAFYGGISFKKAANRNMFATVNHPRQRDPVWIDRGNCMVHAPKWSNWTPKLACIPRCLPISSSASPKPCNYSYFLRKIMYNLASWLGFVV